MAAPLPPPPPGIRAATSSLAAPAPYAHNVGGSTLFSPFARSTLSSSSTSSSSSSSGGAGQLGGFRFSPRDSSESWSDRSASKSLARIAQDANERESVENASQLPRPLRDVGLRTLLAELDDLVAPFRTSGSLRSDGAEEGGAAAGAGGSSSRAASLAAAHSRVRANNPPVPLHLIADNLRPGPSVSLNVSAVPLPSSSRVLSESSSSAAANAGSPWRGERSLLVLGDLPQPGEGEGEGGDRSVADGMIEEALGRGVGRGRRGGEEAAADDEEEDDDDGGGVAEEWASVRGGLGVDVEVEVEEEEMLPPSPVLAPSTRRAIAVRAAESTAHLPGRAQLPPRPTPRPVASAHTAGPFPSPADLPSHPPPLLPAPLVVTGGNPSVVRVNAAVEPLVLEAQRLLGALLAGADFVLLVSAGGAAPAAARWGAGIALSSSSSSSSAQLPPPPLRRRVRLQLQPDLSTVRWEVGPSSSAALGAPLPGPGGAFSVAELTRVEVEADGLHFRLFTEQQQQQEQPPALDLISPDPLLVQDWVAGLATLHGLLSA
jgi:hypothetical protein